VHAVAAQTERRDTAAVAQFAATTAGAYVAKSSDQSERLLKVMRAYLRDQKSLESGMAVMYAVKTFEEQTAGGYQSAKEAAVGNLVLIEALDAFRQEQVTLAKRLMNSDESEWESILTETKRLSDRVEKVARAAFGT
jgi:GTP-binding protein EngB required for normal cell division